MPTRSIAAARRTTAPYDNKLVQRQFCFAMSAMSGAETTSLILSAPR
jgi:hypothetical protein